MKLTSLSFLACFALLASACTWVEPDSAGSRVRVATGLKDGDCTSVGDVTVSVKARVAGIDRKDIKVRDELESLARNQAAASGADTIQAVSEPFNGEQRFKAYRCN